MAFGDWDDKAGLMGQAKTDVLVCATIIKESGSATGAITGTTYKKLAKPYVVAHAAISSAGKIRKSSLTMPVKKGWCYTISHEGDGDVEVFLLPICVDEED